ncbi:MAG: DUF5719 family protein [Actinomycetota bacterium]|nr:DUF5719 family protein [Actinomycetota bacterium]
MDRCDRGGVVERYQAQVDGSQAGSLMTERVRELMLVVVVVALAVAGAALGAGSDDVEAVTERSTPAAFVERAVYCPPSLAEGDSNARFSVAGRGEGATVGLEPSDQEELDLAPGQILVGSPSEGSAVDVVGFGAPVEATALTRAPEGAGATGCSALAGTRWYFAAGSSALGYDERIMVYNPFPEESVVRLSFYTPTGEKVKANLTDIPVRAGTTREISVNEFITLQDELGASVSAIRGRVVAWRMLVADPKTGTAGVEFSLGTRQTSPTWFFPAGGAGTGVTEAISLLNPSTTEEAAITISLTTNDGSLQPQKLVEISVPPGSSKRVPLYETPPARLGSVTDVSALVTSSNGIEVVAERTTAYKGEGGGLTGEIGAVSTAREWFLGPAALDPASDRVSVMNPASEDAILDVTLMFEDSQPKAPAALQELVLGAGLRREINLDRWTTGRAAWAVITSEAPIVAERSAFDRGANDPADVMGTPVRR